MRNVNYTDEFLEFLKDAEPNVKTKIDYILDIMVNQPIINSKIAKKLTNEILYEVRIQINNEYRILCFAVDHDNITQAKHILFLSGFRKKATKYYNKEIKKALKILEKWTDQN